MDDAHRRQIYLEYTNFKIAATNEKAQNSFRFQLLADRSKTPLEWWLTDGGDYSMLQKVAIKLFSMATSTAASERNFSTMGFIYLSSETAWPLIPSGSLHSSSRTLELSTTPQNQTVKSTAVTMRATSMKMRRLSPIDRVSTSLNKTMTKSGSL